MKTTLQEGDVTLLDQYLKPGYGIVTPRLRDTVRTIGRLHGLVLDPVYNAKTAHALIDQATTRAIPQGSTVVLVFIRTTRLYIATNSCSMTS